MSGVITGREVVSNLGVIYEEFGPRCVLRCLWALMSRQPTTFLDVACKPQEQYPN